MLGAEGVISSTIVAGPGRLPAGVRNGFAGANRFGLLFCLRCRSDISCLSFSKVTLSPGNLASIAWATSRSENWFSNSAHEEAFSNFF